MLENRAHGRCLWPWPLTRLFSYSQIFCLNCLGVKIKWFGPSSGGRDVGSISRLHSISAFYTSIKRAKMHQFYTKSSKFFFLGRRRLEGAPLARPGPIRRHTLSTLLVFGLATLLVMLMIVACPKFRAAFGRRAVLGEGSGRQAGVAERRDQHVGRLSQTTRRGHRSVPRTAAYSAAVSRKQVGAICHHFLSCGGYNYDSTSIRRLLDWLSKSLGSLSAGLAR